MGNKLSKHPFCQRNAGQNSLKCKKKWNLFCTQPALAWQGPGAAAFQERGIKHRRWSWAEQQPRQLLSEGEEVATGLQCSAGAKQSSTGLIKGKPKEFREKGKMSRSSSRTSLGNGVSISTPRGSHRGKNPKSLSAAEQRQEQPSSGCEHGCRQSVPSPAWVTPAGVSPPL